MPYKIDAKNLLLNYFTTHPEEHKLQIRYIKELGRKVEEELVGLHVYVYKDDLIDAIVRTDAFKWNENEQIGHNKYCDSIERIITHKDLKEIEPGNWNISHAVRDSYLEIVKKYEWDTLPHTAWHIVYKSLMRCQVEKDKDFLTRDECNFQLCMTSGIGSKFEVGTTQKYILQGLVDRKMAKQVDDYFFMQDKIFWGR
ncbi:hypothetical protein KY321_04975 [Candidatus Woesearchaeota archaeon]|nr:hypothetical protein [Candidatus Woesearchaeota archaeon]